MPLKITFDTDVRSARWTDADARVIKKAVRATIQHVIPGLSRDLRSRQRTPSSTARALRQTPAQGRGDRFVVSVVLSTNSYVKKLNAEWRGKDKPTNILSFPTDELKNHKIWPAKLPLPLGDLVLAHETCARESKTFGIKFHHHLMHLAVHGTLHLLGHDHETDADHRKMLRAEISVLQQLGLANPYPLMQNSLRNA